MGDFSIPWNALPALFYGFCFIILFMFFLLFTYISNLHAPTVASGIFVKTGRDIEVYNGSRVLLVDGRVRINEEWWCVLKTWLAGWRGYGFSFLFASRCQGMWIGTHMQSLLIWRSAFILPVNTPGWGSLLLPLFSARLWGRARLQVHCENCQVIYYSLWK